MSASETLIPFLSSLCCIWTREICSWEGGRSSTTSLGVKLGTLLFDFFVPISKSNFHLQNLLCKQAPWWRQSYHHSWVMERCKGSCIILRRGNFCSASRCCRPTARSVVASGGNLGSLRHKDRSKAMALVCWNKPCFKHKAKSRGAHERIFARADMSTKP